uniref:Protein LTV1 homolog n=1 Tax=Ditylenchus dipsaci TaxID=166011 RepID=A0A915DB29_9BILA
MVNKKKNKCFIKKNSGTTFRLVHRSQKDPLIADDSVGERVLMPIASKNIEERNKYGIYYKDDYDYLQHLKNVGETVEMGEVERTIIQVPSCSIQLPSAIFETEGVELKVGLLNQAAPCSGLFPDIDPDIAAALDGEFEGDDFLEDDFMEKANGVADDGSEMDTVRITDEVSGKNEMMKRFGLARNEKFSDESSSDGEDCDGEDSHLTDLQDDKEERRTRFTNYSMSSAVIKRPDGLQTIDDHFEQLYEQYDAEKLGEGDEAELGEITGFIEQDSERMKKLVEEYAGSKRRYMPEKPNEETKRFVLTAFANEKEDNDEEMEDDDKVDAKRQKWDCESVLSTYSNVLNNPVIIREASSKKRKDVLAKKALEQMDDSDECSDVYSVMTGKTNSTMRPKGETAEQRRIRKQAVKQERRERRVEKKSNQFAFKERQKEEQRQLLHSRVKTRAIK